MGIRTHTDRMLAPMPTTFIQDTTRDALTGALATDPVLPEHRRTTRRPAAARPTPNRARVRRPAATGTRSS